jgi:hypothetical protein
MALKISSKQVVFEQVRGNMTKYHAMGRVVRAGSREVTVIVRFVTLAQCELTLLALFGHG